MGNVPFEYATTTVDAVAGTEFFVYADETTEEVVDTFRASKLEDDVFYDEVVLRQIDASVATPLVYKTADVVPTILLTLHRESKAGDEALVRTWMSALQENDILKRAEIRVDYTAKNGELLDDGTDLDLSF